MRTSPSTDHAQLSAGQVLLKLAPLLRPHRRTFLRCVVLLFTGIGLALAGPLLIRHALDVNIPERDLTGLLVTVGAFAAVQVVMLIARYKLLVRTETMGQHVITDLKVKLFRHVSNQSMSFFHRTKVGSLLTRIESDTDALRHLFASVAVEVIGSIFLVFAMLAVMVSVDWRLTLIVVAVFGPMFWIMWYLGVKLGPLFHGVRKTASEITATASEYLQGIQVVQVYNQQDRTAAELDRRNEGYFEQRYNLDRPWITFFTSTRFVESLAIALVLWFGGWWTVQGTTTVGIMVMFIGYIRRFFEPLHILSEQANMAHKAIGAARRIFDLLAETPDITDPEQPREYRPLRQGVAFDGVSFAYKAEEWVLRDVSFTVPKGEHWAIVGRTGSGKSTLMNLLYRFHDPQEGWITADGVDIRDMRVSDWRRHLRLVLQDIQLFPGTILDNLRLFRTDITPAQVEEAARQVQADGFISRLPNGYETVLDEGGQNLSVGQRQLLSFARALVFDPDILILDEATSAIDPATEALIQESLQRLWQGRTSIIIAHRLATIMHCDKVIVLDNGRILELGSPEALIDQGGHFAGLHELQFQGQMTHDAKNSLVR